MAVAVKALLLAKDDTLGNGLRAIRERESEMIDISEYEPGLSDATSSTIQQYIIKDNKVYKTIRTYFDLDNNTRLLLCKEQNEVFDVLPELVEESEEDENDGNENQSTE